MSSETAENSPAKIEKKFDEDQKKENGVDAMSSKNNHATTSANAIKNLVGEVTKFVSKYSSVTRTPPPPPPPTPVQLKNFSEHSVDVNNLHFQLTSQVENEISRHDNIEISSDIPEPPPLLSNQLNIVFNEKNVKSVGFVTDIKLAKLALKPIPIDTNECKNVEALVGECDEQRETKSLALMEIPKKTKLDDISKASERKLKIQKLIDQQSTAKPSLTTVAIPLPSPTKSALSAPMDISPSTNEEGGNGKAHEKTSEILKTEDNNQKAVTLHCENNHYNEEELSLQVPSERSSTPYTHAVTSGDLTNASEQRSPGRDDVTNTSNKQNLSAVIRQNFRAKKTSDAALKNTMPLVNSDDCQKEIHESKSIRYSPPDLRIIGKDVLNAKSKQWSFTNVQPNIINCNVIELEARLKRFNIFKAPDGEVIFDVNNNNNNVGFIKSRCNDMMPTFCKRKFMDESIIRSQPSQFVDFKDPAIITNQRRIGSGRIKHNKWSANFQSHLGNQRRLSKLSEDCHQSTKQINVDYKHKDSNENSRREHNSELTFGKSNYVKRVLSGFLVVSNPKDRERAEKTEQQYKNQQNEEPEWFSCGPTSRLDTIELCGFDDDDEQLHLSSETNSSSGSHKKADETGDSDESKENRIQNANKSDDTSCKPKWADNISKYRKLNSKSDLNNNECGIKHAEAATKANNCNKSENVSKKSLAFQYDQFSGNNNKSRTYVNENRPADENNGTCSRFIQFFANNLSRKNTSEEMAKSNSSSSLNDFFKKALKTQIKAESLVAQHKAEDTINEQRSKHIKINEIPLVDELEAQWRQNITTRGKTFHISKNDSNNLENFQKLIGQLNNQSAQKSEQLQPQQQYQSNFGFNNISDENLSNLFFKHQQKHPQKQPPGINQLTSLQQQYNKQNILLQQQQAALLANLQLKAILSRPEAQMYLLGLAKGEISKHGLFVQLANPHLSQREREAMTAVLTFTSAQQQQQQQQQQQLDTLSNNLIVNQLQNLQNLAIVQQTLAAQQQQQQQQQQQHHQQQQSHGGGTKRLTTIQPMSPEELQAHASLIMQSALIKRKLEEQTNALGLQKMLQLNAAAQVAKQQHQQALHRNTNDSTSANTHNMNPTTVGGRRLQALQNLFNDANGLVDNSQPQQNLNTTNVGGNDVYNYTNPNNKNNRKAYFPNQQKRSTSSSSSGLSLKFSTEVQQQQQQCQISHSQTQYPNSAMTNNSHLHQTGKKSKMDIIASQQPTVVSGGAQ